VPLHPNQPLPAGKGAFTTCLLLYCHSAELEQGGVPASVKESPERRLPTPRTHRPPRTPAAHSRSQSGSPQVLRSRRVRAQKPSCGRTSQWRPALKCWDTAGAGLGGSCGLATPTDQARCPEEQNHSQWLSPESGCVHGNGHPRKRLPPPTWPQVSAPGRIPEEPH
jgi:hypothetical protein